MQKTHDYGYLEIFSGPMYSGKTSKILDIYKQCKFCNINVMVINHYLDTRYHNEMLSTHDNNMIPCYQLDKLLSLFSIIDIIDQEKYYQIREVYNKARVILINEGQFFPDLVDSVKMMIKDKKHVYVAGLDGDFEQKKFGQILDLIPFCDKFTKYTSLCVICKNGTAAIFSKRLSNEKTQMIIGNDNYIPVCRSCYDNPI